MSRLFLKPIKLSAEATASIHQNMSRGYTEISPSGERTFVPYTSQEFGEMHGFVSPSISRYKHMKWTKTRQWQDRTKATKSKWKYHPTYRGLNTVPK